MQIRPEKPEDRDTIHRLNRDAFGQVDEARLVDELRLAGRIKISLVSADENGAIVGHILFSAVTLESAPRLKLVGLAPLAVSPDRQRQGIGGRLIEAGLAACTRAGFDGVVVLGHADYYPRFGFAPASRFGLRSVYDVPDEVFMALELRPNALSGHTGTVHFAPEFACL